jgi:hypothetical protein
LASAQEGKPGKEQPGWLTEEWVKPSFPNSFFLFLSIDEIGFLFFFFSFSFLSVEWMEETTSFGGTTSTAGCPRSTDSSAAVGKRNGRKPNYRVPSEDNAGWLVARSAPHRHSKIPPSRHCRLLVHQLYVGRGMFSFFCFVS